VTTIKKPNFSSAYTKANEILVSSNVICTFPYSPKDLVKEKSEIPCRTFAKARSYGVDIEAFGSESAIIIELGGRRIIFYDESKPLTHVKYSILHELGHDQNGHDLGATDPDAYYRYEIETNYFAAQLLMPEQVLRELASRGVRIDKRFLIEHFEVSETAAQKRIETLAKTNTEWRSRAEKEYDDVILWKFSAFMDAICPRRVTYDFEDEYERQRERDSWF
jgi:hypothetical protein